MGKIHQWSAGIKALKPFVATPDKLAESYSDYVHIAEAGAFDPDWESKSGY